MVTAGTYRKQRFFDSPSRRDLLLKVLFDVTAEFGWALEAWAVLENHYHFVARAPPDSESLRSVVQKLHANSARMLNRESDTPGRRVWFQYWDTALSFRRSYLARLHYTHQNPVKHGVVSNATNYPWCSAAWFAENASPAFRRMVESFALDRVSVPDDF